MSLLLLLPAGVGWAPALDLLLKVTLVLALAALATRLLRRQSAAVRHFVWQLALLGSLALSVSPALPWNVRMPMPSWWSSTAHVPVITQDRVSTESGSSMTAPRSLSVATESGRRTASTHVATRTPLAPAPGSWLLILWALGFLGVLAWSALGHLCVARLVRKARVVRDPSWLALLERVAPVHNPRGSVVLLESDELSGPVACGLVRPCVVLPRGSESWTPARKRAVLLHELAHVARRDPVTQSLAWLACAAYWFHPGVWAAAQSLRKESERACDDRVLSAGVEACDYAAELLDVARSALGLRLVGAAAIAMARRSSLEGRLLSLLDDGLERGRLGPRGRIAGVIGLAALIAVLGPLQGSPASRAAAASPRSVEAPAPARSPVARAIEDPSSPPAPPVQEQPVAVEAAAKALDTAGSTLSSDLLASANADHGDEDDDSDEGTDFMNELPAPPGGTLLLDLDTGGSVEIHGWNEHNVSVHAVMGGRDRNREQTSMDHRGSEIRLRTRFQDSGRGDYSTSNTYEIKVPSRFNVRLHSAGGGITIVGVEGRFSGTTGGGEIVLEHVGGEASLSTGGGEIRVSDSDLSGFVSTGGGVVRLSNVRGGLHGSSGSGPVLRVDRDGSSEESEEGSGDLGDVHIDRSGKVHDERRRGGGVLSFQNAGGGIHLDSAPHGVRGTTGGGDIVIRSAGGPVDVTTGGGDIEIGPSSASVQASTGAGDIHVVVAGRGSRSRSVELASGTGRVVLELPADLDATLELETAFTRASHPAHILSDWDLEPTVSSRWDGREGTPRKYVRAQASFGSGSMRVRIKTVNGDIEVRRATR